MERLQKCKIFYGNLQKDPILFNLIKHYFQAVRPFAQAGDKNADFSPLALFAYFVNRCQENLHIVIAFSPIGDAFRNRLRQFPSLINCCTIDWFQV